MSGLPIIDVIMPAKNSAKYIGAAIESILVQSIGEFRVIVVDNGSSDDTLKLAWELQKRDGRIELFEKPDGNVAEVLNFAAAQGNAPYIMRMDSDDVSMPKRMELLLDVMKKSARLGVVSGSLSFTDADLKPFGSKEVLVNPKAIARHLPIENTIMNGAALMRREMFEDIGGYDPRFEIAEDYDLWLRMIDKWRARNIADVVLYYRKHGNSLTTNRSKLNFYTAYARLNFIGRRLGHGEISGDYKPDHIAPYCQFFEEIAPELSNRYDRRIAQISLRNLRRSGFLSEEKFRRLLRRLQGNFAK